MSDLPCQWIDGTSRPAVRLRPWPPGRAALAAAQPSSASACCFLPPNIGYETGQWSCDLRFGGWPLLLALFTGGATFPVRADQPCPAVEGQFSGPTAVFKSGQELPREGIFSLALQPAETVDYLSGSRRVKGDGGHGGVLTLRLVAAGRYRLFLSSPVELELIQDYSPLPLDECRGEQAGYVVSLGEGKGRAAGARRFRLPHRYRVPQDLGFDHAAMGVSRTMAKSSSPKHLAARICTVLHELTGADLHWIGLKDVCQRLKEPHTAAMDAALKFASDAELLTCGPLPVQSVMLTHKGVMAVRGKMKR